MQGQIFLPIKYNFTLKAVCGLCTSFNKEIVIVTFVQWKLLDLPYLKAVNHLLGLV